MTYNYPGLEDKEIPVRYISQDVEPTLRGLLEGSIREAYDDPVGFFAIGHEDPDDIGEWEELMKKACTQLGLRYEDIVADCSEFERERFASLRDKA